MAPTVHDTILLSMTLDGGGLPNAGYHVHAEGLSDNDYGAIVAERGLTGLLHVHRATSGGLVMQFRDYIYTLVLTLAEYQAVTGLVGHICYFMPHYRDDAVPASYRRIVLVHPLADQRPMDTAQLQWWSLSVKLTDAASNTVG